MYSSRRNESLARIENARPSSENEDVVSSDLSSQYRNKILGRSIRYCRIGFTLVELMVVIVIIGLLAGAVTVGVRSYMITGKQNVARMEISKICQAVETFYVAYDRYPSNDEGIEVLTRPNPKFADGLLQKIPRDPWGKPYQYNQPGRTKRYEVLCYGADAREGGVGPDQDFSSDDLGEVVQKDNNF